MSTEQEHARKVESYLKSLFEKEPGLESLSGAERPGLAESAESLGASNDELESLDRADGKLKRGEALEFGDTFALEAIILPDQRPVVDVIHDNFHEPTQQRWSFLGKQPTKKRIVDALPAIGRVDLVGAPSVPYIGTGFMISRNLMLTNRHVADDFTAGLGTELRFITGLGSEVDFERWILPSDGFVLQVEKTVLIHPWWDAAILEVSGFPADRKPLSLIAERPSGIVERQVAAVGYPAFDSRNRTDVQNRVFRGVYDVKRLQPGTVTGVSAEINSFGKPVQALPHDCSTMGGNSGSALLDLETGHVIALHFGGVYLDSNYAVPAWELVSDPRIADLGVEVEGTPQAPGGWIDIWDQVTEAPSVVVPGHGKPAEGRPEVAAASVHDWFERSGDDEIARAYLGDSAATRQRLVAALGQEEAADYIGDLEEELNASQTSVEGLFSRAPDPDLPEIILLHGIMGGHLAHQGFFRNRLWIEPFELVKGNLAGRLTLDADGETDYGDLKIEPDGHIKLAYSKAARKWRKQGFVVHPFSFDWRKSVRHAAHQLHLFVEQRHAANPGRPLVLVAHSMGGLVASLYSERYPEWSDRIEQAVLVGSPLGGSYASPMAVYGYNELVNKLAFVTRSDDVTTFRRMAASAPGLMDMLPHPDLFEEARPFYRQAGWPEDTRPGQRWLVQSLNLKGVLRQAPLLARTTLIVNVTHGTVETWLDSGEPGPATGVGDGTVPARSFLIDGLPAFKADRGHGDLLNDPKAIEGVTNLLKSGHTGLDPVIPADLVGPLAAEEAVGEETIDEAAVNARRDRFSSGRLTREDLRWLGDF